MEKLPLITCIMPTCNRRKFVLLAIKYFLRQDYLNKELVILDDGSDSVADLVPNDPQIRYLRLTGKRTLGSKRNECVEASRGDLIMHWDDDDWMAPHRIRYQVEKLLKNQAEICGTNKLLFFDVQSQKFWLYEYPIQNKLWLAGGTLCYLKSFWLKNKFPDINIGEDTRFIWNNRLEHALILADYSFYVAIIHPFNTCQKQLSPPYWRRFDHADLHGILDVNQEFIDDSTYYKQICA